MKRYVVSALCAIALLGCANKPPPQKVLVVQVKPDTQGMRQYLENSEIEQCKKMVSESERKKNRLRERIKNKIGDRSQITFLNLGE